MIDQEALESIQNLHRLKTDGIITEDEFERSKQKILFGSKPASKAGAAVALPAQDDIAGFLTLPLQRYADFTGRSGRREFWLFQLVPTAIVLIVLVVMGAGSSEYGETSVFEMMTLVCAAVAILAIAVPQLALEVRRFHDQDKSGWFVLLNLIPYVGALIVLVMMALPGTDGDNQFGPPPEAK